VLVFSQGKAPAEVRLDWPEIGMEAGAKSYVRDLWKHAATGPHAGGMTVAVAPNDVAFLRVSETEAFPTPPIIVADSYRVALRGDDTGPRTLAGTITVRNRGTGELPLWKVRGGLPSWLSVKVAKNGPVQVFTCAASTAGLKKGFYHAIVRADNVEPVSGKPLSALYFDVDLEVAADR